jgi:hypothetical protein
MGTVSRRIVFLAEMVLSDGGGRGRPRSDRRAGVDAVVGLLIDGGGWTKAPLRAHGGQKPLKRIHEHSSVGARPSSADPVE